jgi:hypothetical protein
MTKFKEVMLDIETLDTSHEACIVQIAAVEFNLETGEIGSEFNELIDPLSSVQYGRKVNENTLSEFWSKQPKEVMDIIPYAFLDGLPLPSSLIGLVEFVNNRPVWGNGVLFDNAIIRNAWKAIGQTKEPWSFRKDMDVRTLVALGRRLGVERVNHTFEGVRHNALDDVKHQVKYCHYIYEQIKEKK